MKRAFLFAAILAAIAFASCQITVTDTKTPTHDSIQVDTVSAQVDSIASKVDTVRK